MPEVGRPTLNQWYLREDTGDTFLVVGYDEDSPTVEIQTADGDVDELDEEAWQSLPLSLCEPPHDWAAPMDRLSFLDREGVESEPDGPHRNEADAQSREPQEELDAWEEADSENGTSEP